MRRTLIVGVVVALLAGGSSAFAASQITSRDIKNGTIKTADISASAKRSLKGQRGPAGPAGPAGPVNVGALVRVERTATVLAGDVSSVTVSCPGGYGLVSGGFAGIAADGEIFFADSFGSKTSWAVGLDNFDSPIDGEVTAIAFCSPSGRAIIASAGRRVDVRAKADALVARQRTLHE